MMEGQHCEWNENQVSMQLEERLNLRGLFNDISPHGRKYVSIIVTYLR